MNVRTGTPNKAVDLKQYQQRRKGMEEMSKWCDVLNGFDEAQVCLALGDYLNCKIHTCLGGKSVKDGIKVMKSGGSTELPSEWQMLSQFTWWYQVIQKKIWRMWGRTDHNAGVHIISGTPGRVLFLGDFPVEVVDPVEISQRNEAVMRCWAWSDSSIFQFLGWHGDVDILDAIDARLLAEVKRIKMLVLDEADEMLSKGFKEQAGKQENWHWLWEACGSRDRKSVV